MKLKDIKLWEKIIPDAELFSAIGDLNNGGLPTLTPYLLEGINLALQLLFVRAEHFN